MPVVGPLRQSLRVRLVVIKLKYPNPPLALLLAPQLEFHYSKPLLQYKIPQNVGIEDKIVGPFSLRQLLILGVGLGISYTLFALSNKFYQLNILEYIVICLPALIALAAALLKIRNVTFTKFILLSLEFAIRPKRRFWDHHGIAYLSDPDLTDKTSLRVVKNEADLADEKRRYVNLEELSATLDSGGFKYVNDVAHDDLDNVDDDDLITQAYFGHRRKEGPVHNMYWRTRDVQKKKLNILAKLPKVELATPQTPSFGPTPSGQPMQIDPGIREEVVQTMSEAEPSSLLEDKGIVLNVIINHKNGGFNLVDQDGEVVEHVRITHQKPESGLYKFAFKLKPNRYEIEFLPVDGYSLPDKQSLDLLKTSKITGVYRRKSDRVDTRVQVSQPVLDSPPARKKRKRKKNNPPLARSSTPINALKISDDREDGIAPSGSKNEVITSLSDLQSNGEIEFNLN